jgi:hypothetical protein
LEVEVGKVSTAQGHLAIKKAIEALTHYQSEAELPVTMVLLQRDIDLLKNLLEQ